MTATKGVIITTTHQLVSPWTAVHWESSTSETPNAPEMKDHSQEAMLSRIPAKKPPMLEVTVSVAADSNPHPKGHHPPKVHSSGCMTRPSEPEVEGGLRPQDVAVDPAQDRGDGARPQQDHPTAGGQPG